MANPPLAQSATRGSNPQTPDEDMSTTTTTTNTATMPPAPTRASTLPHNGSPRKLSQRVLPTPTSLSPTIKNRSPPSHPRLPPSFESSSSSSIHHLPVASRYGAGGYTPHSPYRPGEYQRSECAPSERTRIERKLFDDDGGAPSRNDLSSSPLQPAFESRDDGDVKMVLRNGAPVDLISWLRTNFHHQPPPHTPVTSSMSLAHVQRLLQERFPRVPNLAELHRAVLAAFPRSEWDELPDGKEPPMMRGLTWHGRDVAEEYNPVTPGRPSRANARNRSRSNSPLMSPGSTHRQMPDTPARSVLDDFAELATRTPVIKDRNADSERGRAAAHALALACSSVDRSWDRSRKRAASGSPQRVRRRASTPDALQELLNAAEAVEGSPLNSVLLKTERGLKRRRTLTNAMSLEQRRARGAASPKMLSLVPGRDEVMSGDEDDPVSPLASAESVVSQLVSFGQPQWRRGNTSSTTSQLSSISESIGLVGPPPAGPSNPGKGAGRKVNELPTSTQGQFPGVDCKPPYPYHEMIRHAIEHAPDRKLQLAQIYSSIADRFPFFKTLDDKKTAGWQNSIRHNLSLKKMFVRVNKGDGTPDDTGGKGGWWTVQPGVPDEGRPGRKAKAKRAKDGLAETGSVATSSVAGTPVPMGEHELPLSQQSQSQSQPQSQLQQTHAPRDVFESAPPLPVKHEMSAAPTPLLPAFEPSRAAEPGWADRPEPPREQASPPVPASAPAPPSASAPAPPPLKTEPQNVPT